MQALQDMCQTPDNQDKGTRIHAKTQENHKAHDAWTFICARLLHRSLPVQVHRPQSPRNDSRFWPLQQHRRGDAVQVVPQRLAADPVRHGGDGGSATQVLQWLSLHSAVVTAHRLPDWQSAQRRRNQPGSLGSGVLAFRVHFDIVKQMKIERFWCALCCWKVCGDAGHSPCSPTAPGPHYFEGKPPSTLI